MLSEDGKGIDRGSMEDQRRTVFVLWFFGSAMSTTKPFKRAVARFSRVAGLPLNPLFGSAAVNAPIGHYAEKEETKTPLNLFFLSLQGGQTGFAPEIV